MFPRFPQVVTETIIYPIAEVNVRSKPHFYLKNVMFTFAINRGVFSILPQGVSRKTDRKMFPTQTAAGKKEGGRDASAPSEEKKQNP